MNLISYQTASFGANGQTKAVATEVNSQDKEEDSIDEGAEEVAEMHIVQGATPKESNEN